MGTLALSFLRIIVTFLAAIAVVSGERVGQEEQRLLGEEKAEKVKWADKNQSFVTASGRGGQKSQRQQINSEENTKVKIKTRWDSSPAQNYVAFIHRLSKNRSAPTSVAPSLISNLRDAMADGDYFFTRAALRPFLEAIGLPVAIASVFSVMFATLPYEFMKQQKRSSTSKSYRENIDGDDKPMKTYELVSSDEDGTRRLGSRQRLKTRRGIKRFGIEKEISSLLD